MNEFVWIACMAFSAGVGWTIGVFLIDMAIGSFAGDDDDQ